MAVNSLTYTLLGAYSPPGLPTVLPPVVAALTPQMLGGGRQLMAQMMDLPNMSFLDRPPQPQGSVSTVPTAATQNGNPWAGLSFASGRLQAIEHNLGRRVTAREIDWSRLSPEQLYEASASGRHDLAGRAYAEARNRGIRLREYAPNAPARTTHTQQARQSVRTVE